MKKIEKVYCAPTIDAFVLGLQRAILAESGNTEEFSISNKDPWTDTI